MKAINCSQLFLILRQKDLNQEIVACYLDQQKTKETVVKFNHLRE